MGRMASRRPSPGPARRPPLADALTYRLRVELTDIVPPVWRLVEVPSTLMLDALHPILQTAMGWTDSHLHQFSLGDPQVHWPVERYLTAFDIEEGDEGVAEADVRLDELLQEPGDELRYTYDFGDGWDHVLRLEASRLRSDEDPPAALLDGRRACPPEDCGGPYGYEQVLDLAARAADGLRLEPDDAERLSLTFGPAVPGEVLADAERLDVASIDADLRAGRFGGVLSGELSEELAAALGPDLVALVAGSAQQLAATSPALAELVARCDAHARQALLALITAARVDSAVVVDAQVAATMVNPFAWFVRHVGTGGRALTAQGYLRPADVTAAAEHLHLDDEWIGAMNRESLTPQVAEFRRVAQQVGLVRVAKGRIHATARGIALAEDPVALWWHLAERLPVGRRDSERDAGMLALLAVAAGADASNEVSLGPIMTGLGWRLRSGQPLDDHVVRGWAITTVEALRRLGCFDAGGARRSLAPTAAGRAFARAALRTHRS
jgi:hypothetical protein